AAAVTQTAEEFNDSTSSYRKRYTAGDTAPDAHRPARRVLLSGPVRQRHHRPAITARGGREDKHFPQAGNGDYGSCLCAEDLRAYGHEYHHRNNPGRRHASCDDTSGYHPGHNLPQPIPAGIDGHNGALHFADATSSAEGRL